MKDVVSQVRIANALELAELLVDQIGDFKSSRAIPPALRRTAKRLDQAIKGVDQGVLEKMRKGEA